MKKETGLNIDNSVKNYCDGLLKGIYDVLIINAPPGNQDVELLKKIASYLKSKEVKTVFFATSVVSIDFLTKNLGITVKSLHQGNDKRQIDTQMTIVVVDGAHLLTDLINELSRLIDSFPIRTRFVFIGESDQEIKDLSSALDHKYLKEKFKFSIRSVAVSENFSKEINVII